MKRLVQATLSLSLLAGAAAAQTTVRVSLSPVNTQGNFHSFWGSVSGDGDVIAYQSGASNLTLTDVNAHLPDIFVKVRSTSDNAFASVDSAGNQGLNGSIAPSLSNNGRWVAFESLAPNLVAGDVGGHWDVFVHDRVTGATVRASVSSAGVEGDGDSRMCALSADGQWVAFESDATNLVPGDTNGVSDVFLRDLATGTTTRVSTTSSGAQASGASTWASISSSGRWVAFQSAAADLVLGDGNGVDDVFVKDTLTGALTRVSVGAGGVEANQASGHPSLSAGGTVVAFESDATNLAGADANGWKDVFVRDLAAGTTTRVSLSSLGGDASGPSGLETNRALSAGGRYVAFDSSAADLVAGDTNSGADCFVRDRVTGVTERVSVTAAGAQAGAGSRAASISGDGRFVVFESPATTLVVGDNNLMWDVFLRDRGAAPAPATAYCFGDGSGTACPCGNAGASGAGCANSTGLGASASATGSPSLAADDLAVQGSALTPNQPVLLFGGDNAVNGGAGALFGDGLRCAGGNVRRFGVRVASPAGAAAWGPGLLASSGWAAGDTRRLQLWYRDPAGPCGAAFNLSNGLELVLQP